jgi:hypothetical protein
MYEAAPQPIWTWKYSDGKVSTSSVTATLSDGGTANANMVGAIMRLTTSIAQEPTSMVGAMDGKDNPFSQQRLIVEYTSSSVLKLDSSVDTLTTVKYTISDPIDIEPGAMLAAFQKMCDYEYASLLKVTDKERAFLKAEAAQMLRLAMENDRRTTYARTNTPVYDRFSHTTMDTD